MTVNDLSDHFEIVHLGFLDEPSTEFECEMCGDCFDNMESQKKHKEYDHVLPTEYHNCNICGNLLINKEKLKKHHIKEHGQNFKCQTCDEIFENDDEVINHMSMKHESRNLLESTFFNPSLEISTGG